MTPETKLSLAANAARTEAMRGLAKHGAFNSAHEAYAVILEELDEAWVEIKGNRTDLAVEEMTQVAAMAIRFVAEFSP